MAGSDDTKKPTYPQLESRRNRDLSYGEDAERATRERARQPGANVAFYLIERDAIQLRRMRWQNKQQGACDEIDALATRLAGTWDREAESGAGWSAERRLAQHARPAAEPERRSSALMNQLRRWVGGASGRRRGRRS